jgi:hypothetical protein
VVVVCTWLALFLIAFFLVKPNLSSPGLYYDEAVFGGMAKDFLTGHVHGQHMPDSEVVHFSGRPFPIFVQRYLGARDCWMLMPALKIFGSSVPVLRGATFCWAMAALLLFALAVARLGGWPIAIVFSVLLAFDPTFFFLSVWDWGAAVPSLVCRAAFFFFAVSWWQNRRGLYAFLTGLVAGLGFFNKVDFVVALAAILVALAVCYGKAAWAALRAHPRHAVLFLAGCVIGAGPMLFHLIHVLEPVFSGSGPAFGSELPEKWRTLMAMADGSYFYRLMSVGGRFNAMYEKPANMPALFPGILVAGLVAFFASARRSKSGIDPGRAMLALGLAIGLTTVGLFVVPGAVRLHHAVLVYPLPHLALAAGIVCCWPGPASSPRRRLVVSAAIVGAICCLLGTNAVAIARTQKLVRDTGGRGWWSEQLDEFCRRYRDRTDLTIVSLDWGFDEQLMFLTDGPRLVEPFWTFGESIPLQDPDPSTLYLVHSEEYSLSVYSVQYLRDAEAARDEVQLQCFSDRQGHPAFCSLGFPPLMRPAD